ncbi:unnamed protein product [Symbiodinium natans]|uniref:Uncharacterized protein n=1 Tax=Symbiodinium natans TaxID=878477 RepID=A0A812GLB9_9DINO|nr:unnamed protein product [Symbiodinium natans]
MEANLNPKPETGIADVGLTVGDYVGNAAVIVGNSVVEAAETSIDALPSEIKDAASTLGNVAVAAAGAVADVGEVVADATVDLAGDALHAAKHSIAQGVRLASTVGNEIASKATALGGEIAKLGPLAVGLAKAAWDEIKKFINCLAQSFTLCKMLIGNMCDCDGGSDVSASLSGLSMKCKFKHTGDFAQGFGISSSSSSSFEMGDASSGGKIKLPGNLFQQQRKHSGTSLRSRKAMKGSKSKAPAGSCESSLELALEGVVQFEPTLSISLKTNGDTEVGVEGLVRASFDALATAEGGCGLSAERRFPQKPLKKVACAPPFCIIVLLQMVAEVEMSGVITGSAEVGASADFHIQGSVLVNPGGHADADFQNPTIKHQEGFGLAASAFGSVRVGMGPVLTVWPMPGVPIVINPMFNAEVRAQGTLRLSSGMSLAETQAVTSRTAVTANTSQVHHIDMCGAAAVNLYADVDIQGFAIPKPISAQLGTGWIKEKIEESILKGATALVSVITGPAACIPGAGAVTDFVMDAARAAAGTITGLIPNLHLDFTTPSMQLLGPTKLYCKEVFTSPGFDTAPCAAELGCKFAGRPPPAMVTVLPASQVAQHVHTTHSASACYDLPMGDRFIQLGKWRLAAIDDNHFSISHKDGKTAQIFHKEGTQHPGPRSDFGAWGRSIGAAKGISFGFQFIQIGKFRVGAVDENHLSISHIGGKTAQIFRYDGTLQPGPTTAWSTVDRPESMPAGITAGDRFVQLGKFRLGDADGHHFLVTHDSGQTIQIYRGDGTLHPGPRTDWTGAISTRSPSAWTCKDLPEMAHGACDSGWAGFGDRFIQLGDWRLAAIDATHFSISHKDGMTTQIWRADGTVHNGPRNDYNAWGRPLGFPSGITFGPQFIQIGKWRLGQIDLDHFSIAHQDGKTATIYLADGTLRTGPRTDFNAWDRSSGPAGSITFGDRFIQFGRFRFGDADGTHFLVTHSGGQTIQIFHKQGSLHPGPRTDWTAALNDRYPQWHCGTVQSILGSCTGIAAGKHFLQLGEWRLAAIDGNHFSVSHQAGQTAQIYHGAGTLHPGPRTDFGAWHLETKEVHSSQRLAFGDRFIQFGNFRMGEVNEAHFSISHSGGKTSQIFHKQGTLHPGPRTDFGLWGRPEGDPLGVTFGDRFVQIGNFRVGDVDGVHFSVTHVGGKTAQIFRSDGTLAPGPRSDYTTFGRPLTDCNVLAD